MVRTVPARPTRRRGAALEHALLTVAWAELSENGYASFTMDAVAARAQTSTPVLYRRWPGRWDLALAAFAYYAETNPITVPDTGSLRGDLVAYLRDVSAKRGEIAALFSLRMAEFFNEGDASPAQVREQLVGGRAQLANAIYDRAITRGELDLDALTPRRRSLAFDLLRNELMMTMRPIPRKVIDEIVDDIVLPLITNGRVSSFQRRGAKGMAPHVSQT